MLLLAAGLACGFQPAATLPTATRPPATAPPVTFTPLPPDSGWLEVAPGLEQRTLRAPNGAGDVIETITLLRVDPAAHRFDVQYAPQSPRTVQEWAADTGAAITLNAGYFSPEYTVTGLLVSDGVSYGHSYGNFAGMLAIREDSTQVRWLSKDPYNPTEPLRAAVQSFPVLIKPGGVLGFPQEDGLPARRTVIAQDRAGRILIVVCPNGTFTLFRLAKYLLQSDLELDIALNLDGGASTGLSLALNQARIKIPSFAPVPAVITIAPRK